MGKVIYEHLLRGFQRMDPNLIELFIVEVQPWVQLYAVVSLRCDTAVKRRGVHKGHTNMLDLAVIISTTILLNLNFLLVWVAALLRSRNYEPSWLRDSELFEDVNWQISLAPWVPFHAEQKLVIFNLDFVHQH